MVATKPFATLTPAIAILAVAGLLAAPAATACHVTIGLRASTGVVVADGGAVPAQLLSIGRCTGATTIRLLLSEAEGVVEDSFPATFAVVAPAVDCLTQGCSPVFPPVALFEITNAGLGVDLHGVFLNEGHLSLQYQVSGEYRGHAAAFVVAVG